MEPKRQDGHESKILELCQEHDFVALKKLLQSMNVADIADELSDMDAPEAVRAFRTLAKDKAAEVFAYLDSDIQEQVISAITDSEMRRMIEELFLDDAVDFIEEMPASVVKRVLANISAEKRELLNQFLQYPDDSAGSIMTVEFVSLKSSDTVMEAFRKIRRNGVDKETIYTCYVTEADRRLIGAVSVRAMLLADENVQIGHIMERSVISAFTSEDKESLGVDFRKYSLLAMPVVDNENRLVGIVTVDDVLDVLQEEATEDFEIMAAISPSEEPYLKTSVWKLTKNRVLWLLLLMLSATITGMIITGFEDALATLPALVAFIPMLMNTGGNAGSQSSTLCIRGMALEEIELADARAVVWKELQVAAICGVALVAVNSARMLIIGNSLAMTATVSGSLFCTVLLAKSVGCLLPMGAKRLKLDPAVMSAPVITTFVDASSLMIYFALAQLILHM